jgi:hypothetical protein
MKGQKVCGPRSSFGVNDSSLERSSREEHILIEPRQEPMANAWALECKNKCRLGPQNDPRSSGPEKT